MGFNFRKSKKFGPSKFTLSKRGLSSSIGVKGFRIGVNSRGKVRTTVSIPGTGISYSTTLGGKKSRRKRKNTSNNNYRTYNSSVNTSRSSQTNVGNKPVFIALTCFVLLIYGAFFYAQISMAETIGKKIGWIVAGVAILAVAGFVAYKIKSGKSANSGFEDENIESGDSWYCAECGCKNSKNDRYCKSCNAKK